MTSEVEIINSAMNMIGASNIISRSEDSKAARVSNQRYDAIRDAVLRSHPWNCAVTRAALAPDVDTPAFDWKFQFTTSLESPTQTRMTPCSLRRSAPALQPMSALRCRSQRL